MRPSIVLLLALCGLASSQINEEVPQNDNLAKFAWPIALQNSYSDQSTDLPSIDRGDFKSGPFGPVLDVARQSLFDPIVLLGPTSLLYTDRKGGDTSDGFWSSSFTDICKVSRTTTDLGIVDCFKKPDSDIDITPHGIYSFVTSDNYYFNPNGRRIFALSDAEEGEFLSDIRVAAEFLFDGSDRLDTTIEDDRFYAVVPLYPAAGDTDSSSLLMAYITFRAQVGVLSFDRETETFTEVSNVVALDQEEDGGELPVDELGNIYAVTGASAAGNGEDNKVFRIQFTASADPTDGVLEVIWASAYESVDEPAIGRITPIGSGSSPTIIDLDGELFIVITDGSDPQKLVVYHADDGSVAAFAEVTFGGLPDGLSSFSDQSVLADGTDLYVVNDALTDEGIKSLLDPQFRSLIAVLLGDSPLGIQKFEFKRDPEDQDSFVLESIWTRNDTFIANGIPTLSRSETQKKLLYGDAETGADELFIKTGCDLRYNSLFAATEVGDEQELISGVLFGVVRAIPKDQSDTSVTSELWTMKARGGATQITWSGDDQYPAWSSEAEGDDSFTAKWEVFQSWLDTQI
ncbi:unnamed protein product [Vitrella brassicaformis CCMP3155]|uniref:Phytase-like domain-containing protein n=1 Tax=Vitrella brassicaformis (strain CCMP3155) TaxID=1169540 RepID=A0A0G4ELX6_VITBC|nr:unnamed protein product [Vitrella brassicaformis CCMP3155]|eukprot:CEL98127.1 unnamed protein product [Vitrella brassicaformis CCMP3155]